MFAYLPNVKITIMITEMYERILPIFYLFSIFYLVFMTIGLPKISNFLKLSPKNSELCCFYA